MDAAFPVTTALLAPTGYVSAMFSILDTEKVIQPHKGDYAGVHRYHLVLDMPKAEKDCYIIVARNWTNHEMGDGEEGQKNLQTAIEDGWFQVLNMPEPGGDLYFDDTFLHWSVNMHEGRRVNLFLDIPRHDLPPWLDIWNRFLIKFLSRIHPTIRTVITEANKYDLCRK